MVIALYNPFRVDVRFFFLTQGGARRLRRPRLPWATMFNRFAVTAAVGQAVPDGMCLPFGIWGIAGPFPSSSGTAKPGNLMNAIGSTTRIPSCGA